MAVNLTFNGDSADAQAAIAKLERKYADLENKIKQLGKATKKSGDDGFEAIGKWAKGFLSVETAMKAGQEGVKLLVAEYDNLIAVTDKAKEANINFGKVATNLFQNVGANDSMREAKARILNLSASAVMSPNEIAKILNAAQASKGDQSNETVDRTITAAARVSRLDPEAMELLVGTALDLTKQVKGTSPEQAIGAMLNFGAESHVKDQGQYSKTIGAAAIGMSKADSSGIEYQFALGNAITHAVGDQGKTSATAMIALEMQLAKAFPELKNTAERIAMVQANPDLKNAIMFGGSYSDEKGKKKKLHLDEFEVEGPDGAIMKLGGDKFSFEKRAIPGINQLLTGGSFAANEIQRNLRDVPSLAASGESFEKRALGMGADRNLQAAEAENAFKVNTELTRLQNVQGARDSSTRVNVDEALRARGISDWTSNSVGWGRWQRQGYGFGNKSGEQATLESLESHRDALLSFDQEHNLPSSMTGQSTAEAEKLQEVIDLLKQQLEVAREAMGEDGEGGQFGPGGEFDMSESPRAGRPINRNGNVE